MDTLHSITKRKKRKTRKCLDELRKRSRRNTEGNLPHKRSPPAGGLGDLLSKLPCMKPNNNCITTDRLTIAMFPNAIRSETITRPILPESVQEPQINFKKIVRGLPLHTEKTNCSNSRTENTPSNSGELVRNSDESNKSDFCTYNEYECPKDSDTVKSTCSDQCILFSPGDVTESDIFEETPTKEPSSTQTTPSSQSSRYDYAYHLYEEFINEIPKFLKDNAPTLIKDNLLKKSKALLHNIYVEGCHQESEANILECIKNRGKPHHTALTLESNVVKSPINFLKFNNNWRQSPKSDEPTVDSSGSSQPSPLPQQSLIHDTPMYSYYPHKLN